MKERAKYDVYCQYYLETDDYGNGVEGEWEYAGSTTAVSTKQAINNVRHNRIGDISQYNPIAVSGHWANGLNWKAVKKGGDPNEK